MRIRASAAILFVGLAASASAQAQLKSTDAPIDISADGQEADLNSNAVTYSGNVLVIQGDMRMRSDILRANFLEDGKTPDKILANGRVIIDSPDIGTGSGDAAVYDVVGRQITFTGKVVLTKDKDVLRGTVLTYDLVAHQAKFKTPGGRVQGLFSSPPSSGTTP